MSKASEPRLDLDGLIGETDDIARRRLGAPVAERATGEDRWMLFEGVGWSLRLRARPGREGGTSRIRSWTITFDAGLADLPAACEALGLAPPPPHDGRHPLRLPLIDARSGKTHSLTAVERGGRIRSVTGFDEAPDWSGEAPDWNDEAGGA